MVQVFCIHSIRKIYKTCSSRLGKSTQVNRIIQGYTTFTRVCSQQSSVIAALVFESDIFLWKFLKMYWLMWNVFWIKFLTRCPPSSWHIQLLRLLCKAKSNEYLKDLGRYENNDLIRTSLTVVAVVRMEFCSLSQLPEEGRPGSSTHRWIEGRADEEAGDSTHPSWSSLSNPWGFVQLWKRSGYEIG